MINTLEENLKDYLLDLRLGNNLLEKVFIGKDTESTNHKKNVIQISSKLKIYACRKIASKKINNPHNGKKIFTTHISDKGLVSRICKELP